jgi:hypothetical protein
VSERREEGGGAGSGVRERVVGMGGDIAEEVGLAGMWVVSAGLRQDHRWRRAVQRRKSSGGCDFARLAMRVYQPHMGVLSEARWVETPAGLPAIRCSRSHLAIKTAAASTSLLMTVPLQRRTSRAMSGGHLTRQTSAGNQRVCQVNPT